MEAILRADGILLASPVYVEDVSGVMKNWINRMAYLCHRPALTGKTAGLIITSGTGASNHSLRTMSAAMNAWGAKVSCTAKFKAGARISDEEISLRYEKQIERFAAKFLSAVLGERDKPSFYSLLSFCVQQKYWMNKPELSDTYDYAYWKSKGWLDAHTRYYIHYRGSLLKVATARLAGHILSALLFH
jgi:multimeric flavodoxin WrbA